MWRKYKKSEIDHNNFLCVRLKDDPHHKTLISGFNSDKAPSLAYYLRYKAWHEDQINYRAYYLVKEKERIVLYFSLQSGLLFKSHRKLLSGVAHQYRDKKLEYYIIDDKIDVTKVIPGVELAHFCVNDSYRRKKSSWSVQQGNWEFSPGVYVFYKYIAPKIIEMSKTVGLQYVYLFCADDGSEKLIQYYSDVLNFSVMDDMACIRPEYDSSLHCLTLKLETLVEDTAHFQDLERASDILEYLKLNRTLSIHQAHRLFSIQKPSRLFSKLLESKVVALDASSPLGQPIRISYLS